MFNTVEPGKQTATKNSNQASLDTHFFNKSSNDSFSKSFNCQSLFQSTPSTSNFLSSSTTFNENALFLPDKSFNLNKPYNAQINVS